MKFDKVPLLLIIVVVSVCFGRTLGSYFVADDFSQVAYVAGIFKGDWGALIHTLTGNYLQNPVMRIYRPCLLLSLMFDYAIWHVNAFGYFLTNIAMLMASAIIFYFLLRQLTRNWFGKRSMWFSTFAALLFAANPLHCESISFISGRDNILSSCFFLFALWCFVVENRKNSRALPVLGVISFGLALFSKEMAIALPAVLAAIAFFLPELFYQGETSTDSAVLSKEFSIQERFVSAFRVSLPLWIAALCLLILRYVVLGTVTGGYTGGVGAGLLLNMVSRWTEFDTIYRLIFPLNLDVFGNGSNFQTGFVCLYAVLGALVILRLASQKFPWRWLGLWSIWTLTAVVPLYQLWGLSGTLAGARFFFFLTIPLSLLIPLLLFAPSDGAEAALRGDDPASTKPVGKEAPEEQAPTNLSIAALSLLVILCTCTTYRNNVPWLHAGKQSRACLIEGQKLAKGVPAGKKIALLGLPNDESGAHIIYNGATFDAMMSPPFADATYGQSLITFEPLFFGRPELVNAERLKTVLCDPDLLELMVWNKHALRFDKVDAPLHQPRLEAKDALPIVFQNNQDFVANIVSSKFFSENSGDGGGSLQYERLSAPISADPFQHDFLEFSVKGSSPNQPFFVLWRGRGDWSDVKAPVQGVVTNANSEKKVRIRLSDHWSWFTRGKITELRLEFLPNQSIELKDLRLVSGRQVMPKMRLVKARASNIGFYLPSKDGPVLNYSVTEERDGAAVKFEISKPNYFFDGLSDKESADAVMTTITKAGKAGEIVFPSTIFKVPGYYQIRSIAIDGKGRAVGEMSEPITISL